MGLAYQKIFCCRRFHDISEGEAHPRNPIWFDWDYDGKCYLASYSSDGGGGSIEDYEIFFCPFCGKKIEYKDIRYISDEKLDGKEWIPDGTIRVYHDNYGNRNPWIDDEEEE